MSSATAAAAKPDSAVATNERRGALAFIIDEEGSIRQFVSLILQGSGVDTIEFVDGASFRSTPIARLPDIVFLNVNLEVQDAVASIETLTKAGFTGSVQLISSRGSAVLDNVKQAGEQMKLPMLPVLKKPFETSAIQKVLSELKLGHGPAPSGVKITLAEALKNNWVEFWYQPKIDLRKKQLVGVEAFARARHPQDGILMPGAFLPGATEADLIALSELALAHTLKAALNFAKLGVNLRPAVNVPVNALIKIAVADIVQTYIPQFEKWPGLIIDVTEEQIVTDLALAAGLTKSLQHLDVKLAIDDFGRGYSSLVRLKELPFAELKLDRAFVTDCGTDKVNAPLCKTVIDLAHNFGSRAVAIGIEKASDALALVSMGCDYGQGFLLGQPMPEERFISLLRQRAASQGRQISATRAPDPRNAARQTA